MKPAARWRHQPLALLLLSAAATPRAAGGRAQLRATPSAPAVTASEGAFPRHVEPVPAPLASADNGTHERGGLQRSGRCLELAKDEAVVVRAVGQHYGKETFLLAHGELGPSPDEEDSAALRALIEALLDGCGEDVAGRPRWLVDVGARDTAVVALASSLGCAVAAVDIEDTRELEATRCVNEPERPFQIFSSLAGVDFHNIPNTTQLEGGNLSSRAAPGIAAFNGLSPPDPVDRPAARTATALPAGAGAGAVALLRLVPRRCCGVGAAGRLLEGAQRLLQSRARCVATDLVLDDGAPKLLRLLRGLEGAGYALLHSGPPALPELAAADSGAYPVYRTDSEQLRELYDTFLRIRSFDERTGRRVYGDGLSLSHSGKHFDYTDFVVACRGPLPRRLEVRDKARLRFQGGRWWPEQVSAPSST